MKTTQIITLGVSVLVSVACLQALMGGTVHASNDEYSIPVYKEQCKNGGWVYYVDNTGAPFKNQGQCVAFVMPKQVFVPTD